MKEILKFEMIPDGCWYSNLRTILTREQWEFIKKAVKRRANGKCEICGAKTDRLDAHERWSYDEKKCVQKLEEVVAVCKDCHSVIHIGRTQLKGDTERAERHYQKVNGATYAEYRAALGKANEEHQRLNRVSEWKLDISKLKDFAKD